MSKKKEEEKKPEFRPPPFDKEEFLKEEIMKMRVTLFMLIFAAVIGLATFAIANAGQVALAIFTSLMALVASRYLFTPLKLDETVLEKKNWIGNSLLYIFVLFAIWLLLSNPPFMDQTHPYMEDIDIYVMENGNWTAMNITNKDFLLNPGKDIRVNMELVDNSDVSAVVVTVTNPNGTTFSPTVTEAGDDWSFIIPNPVTGSYKYIVEAEDDNSNSGQWTRELEVKQKVI